MCGEQVLRIGIALRAGIIVVMPELGPAVTILLGAFYAFAWRPEDRSVAPAIIIPLGLERFHDDCTNMTWTCSAISRQVKTNGSGSVGFALLTTERALTTEEDW